MFNISVPNITNLRVNSLKVDTDIYKKSADGSSWVPYSTGGGGDVDLPYYAKSDLIDFTKAASGDPIAGATTQVNSSTISSTNIFCGTVTAQSKLQVNGDVDSSGNYANIQISPNSININALDGSSGSIISNVTTHKDTHGSSTQTSSSLTFSSNDNNNSSNLSSNGLQFYDKPTSGNVLSNISSTSLQYISGSSTNTTTGLIN